MKRLNKVLYSVGSLAAVAAPMAAVISCGTDELKPGLYLALDGHDHSAQDKSFNQQGYEGIKGYGTLQGIVKPAAPDQLEQFKQMYANVPKKSTIIAPGFKHVDPLKSAVEEIQDKKVILLDGEVKKANIASVVFKVEQAAYVAGYALAMDATTSAGFAHYNKVDTAGGKVLISTFGGSPYPSVTGFMGGFQKGIAAGIAKAKTATAAHPHHADVEFVKFGTRPEHFTGGFAPGGATAMVTKMKDKKVDIVLPVAGPQTGDFANASGYAPLLVGVDVAQAKAYSSMKERFVFSILKNLKDSIINVLKKINGETVTDSSIKGLNETTVGTLANNLVGISDNVDFPGHASIKAAVAAAKADAAVTSVITTLDPNFFYA